MHYTLALDTFPYSTLHFIHFLGDHLEEVTEMMSPSLV